MTAPGRFLACTLTLAAMLSPSATVAWTVIHLALDAHHHEVTLATDEVHHYDTGAAVHGHHHDHGTPAHSHDTTAAAISHQLPSPTVSSHPSVTGVTSAAPAADMNFVARFEPSPPQRVPIILRI
jgi:hypothetical protein